MDPTAVCGHLSLCRPPVSPWILRQESAGSVRGPAGEDGGQWGTSPALTKGAGFSGTVWRQQRGTSLARLESLEVWVSLFTVSEERGETPASGAV